MKRRINWKYREVPNEERRNLTEVMIRNSESLAMLAENKEIEAHDMLSGLWVSDHATGESMQLPPSDSEATFLHGTDVVTPVLVAFAIELALKAMIAQENEHPWIDTHDLECLYGQLTAQQRNEIDGVPKRPNRSTMRGEQVTELGNFESVEATLRFHRNLFVEWRYQYEDMLTRREPAKCHLQELQIAQWMVIDAARRRQDQNS